MVAYFVMFAFYVYGEFFQTYVHITFSQSEEFAFFNMIVQYVSIVMFYSVHIYLCFMVRTLVKILK